MASKIIRLKFNNTKPFLRVRAAGPKLTYRPTRPVLRFRYPETTSQQG